VLKPVVVGVLVAAPMGALVAAAGAGLLGSLALGVLAYALTLALVFRFNREILT
jgi:hypothetical protein